ncbi:hypothetical protein BDZ45DRAFT_761258 [Acephala macrosclerotiorum]|nr:hypothetical protein BDZ45DRAFT_761258 [Acephala macrosclerotiorum]
MSSPNTEEWAPRQQRALNKLRLQGTWNLGNTNNLLDLTRWFTIFNNAFFGGLLAGYCELEYWDEKAMSDRYDNEYLLGFAQRRVRLGKPECLIVVLECSNDLSNYLIKDILETLLHEMVHVIFMVYQCLSDPEPIDHQGSHHVYWQLASDAIEDVVKVSGQTEFGMGLGLGREKALAADINGGYLFPTDVKLRILNLDILLILDGLRLFRKQQCKDTDLKKPEQAPIKIIPQLTHQCPESEQHSADAVSQQIADAKFRERCLVPFSYTPEEISTAIVYFVSKSTYYCKVEDLAPRQQLAIQQFKHQGSWHLGNPHNLDDIKKYFQIFDNAYSNGSLNSYCKLELVESKYARQRVEKGFDNGNCEVHEPGKERDPRYTLDRPQVTITIRKQDTPLKPQDSFTCIQTYLIILLHEMLHAMFELYTCRCNRGCRQRLDDPSRGRHHMPWQIATFAIDEANILGRNLFGLESYSGRHRGLAADVQCGSTLPGDDVLRSIDLMITSIRNKLKESRQKDAVKARRERISKMPIKSGSVCIRDQWTVDSWQGSFGYERREWAELNPEFMALDEIVEKLEYLP